MYYNYYIEKQFINMQAENLFTCLRKEAHIMVGALGGMSGFAYGNVGISPNEVKTNTGEVIDKNSMQARSMKQRGQLKCETCAERKYKDGSDENVSYKAATHISPQAAAGAVRAHEQEHVSNAYSKASKDNGQVVSANVRISMAICPECGRSYVSGGLTTTQIKFDKSNPYTENQKELLDDATSGKNVDYAV